jgi:hypothetical protein
MKSSWFVYPFLVLCLSFGLLVVGCNDDDDDSVTVVTNSVPGEAGEDPPAADPCQNDATFTGNWTTPADPAERSFGLGDGGQATFTEDLKDPMSPGIQVTIGTWSHSGCDLSLNSGGIPAMNGGGTVNGNQVTINGRVYTK